jgi:hypothetical protein
MSVMFLPSIAACHAGDAMKSFTRQNCTRAVMTDAHYGRDYERVGAQYLVAFPLAQSTESWGMSAPVQKITFAEMRAAGVRGVLIYCSDYRCSHSTRLVADRWPDDIRLSDIEVGFVCTACGRRGADVRPAWDPLRPRPKRP